MKTKVNTYELSDGSKVYSVSIVDLSGPTLLEVDAINEKHAIQLHAKIKAALLKHTNLIVS